MRARRQGELPPQALDACDAALAHLKEPPIEVKRRHLPGPIWVTRKRNLAIDGNERGQFTFGHEFEPLPRRVALWLA